MQRLLRVLTWLSVTLPIPALSAQTAVMLAPELMLLAPARDFLKDGSGFRTKFGTTVGFKGSVHIRATRYLSIIAHGSWATPNANSMSPGPAGNRTRSSGRVFAWGAQLGGHLPVSSRSRVMLAAGPTRFQQKIWDRPNEKAWNHSASWGLSASLQLQHHLSRGMALLLGGTYQTYHADAAAVSPQTPTPGQQQHDLVLSAGFGIGL